MERRSYPREQLAASPSPLPPVFLPPSSSLPPSKVCHFFLPKDAWCSETNAKTIFLFFNIFTRKNVNLKFLDLIQNDGTKWVSGTDSERWYQWVRIAYSWLPLNESVQWKKYAAFYTQKYLCSIFDIFLSIFDNSMLVLSNLYQFCDHCYKGTKQPKFLITIIYRLPRRHSNS